MTDQSPKTIAGPPLSEAPGSALCEWKYTETLGCKEAATWQTPCLMESGMHMWKLCDTHRRNVQSMLDGKLCSLDGNPQLQWIPLRQNTELTDRRGAGSVK
jgi:hypothetical protein